MPQYPAPAASELLLPLVACLPTAFFSSKPPPPLLPLLSPILRQRVTLLTSGPSPANAQSLQESNWLNLLTWSPSRAQRVLEICSQLQLEPHPVSGELELFEDEPGQEPKIQYRRLDAETFQAKSDISKYGLSVVWTWCVNDSGVALHEPPTSDAQDGWRVAEVRPLEIDEDDQRAGSSQAWHDTQAEAEEGADSFPMTDDALPPGLPRIASAKPVETSAEDDDDYYWASYDKTPAQSAKPSPAPRRTPIPRNGAHMAAASDGESEYFARYGDVQPALDAHDPDEEDGVRELQSELQGGLQGDVGSGMNGLGGLKGHAHSPPPPNGTGLRLQDGPVIHSPIPSRPASPGSPTSVDRLEVAAAAPATTARGPGLRAESFSTGTTVQTAVRQHLSTEIKSLYRLARATGMDRAEFAGLLAREAEVLEMVDF